MHSIDLWPTLLAVAGAPPKPELNTDGTNLLPVWTGQQSVPDRVLFWEWRTEGVDQVAAMRGPWKVVITSKGSPELFNVVTDPAERRNAAAQYPDRVKELKSALDQWLATEVSLPGTQPNSR